MMYGSPRKIVNGDKSSSQIRAITSDLPVAEGPAGIPHIADLYLYLSWVLQNTGTTARLILNDFLMEAFSSLTLRLKDGRHLYKTTNARILRVFDVLTTLSTDDWDLAGGTTKTITARVTVKLPLNFPEVLDRPDELYLYPAEEIAEFLAPLNTSVSGFTTTTFNWELWADTVYLPSKTITPVRTWRNYTGAADQVTIPAGKHQYIGIFNDKGADANLYDSGLTISGGGLHYNAVDSRILNLIVSNEQVPGQTKLDDRSATTDDLFVHIWMPSLHKGTRQTTVNGSVQIKHDSADPDIADVFVLSVE